MCYSIGQIFIAVNDQIIKPSGLTINKVITSALVTKNYLNKWIRAYFLSLDEVLAVLPWNQDLEINIIHKLLDSILSILDILDKLIVQDERQMLRLYAYFRDSSILNQSFAAFICTEFQDKNIFISNTLVVDLQRL